MLFLPPVVSQSCAQFCLVVVVVAADTAVTVVVAHCYCFVAGELCKLARVTGPEFPPPFSPVGRCLPATGRCRAVRYKRQCLNSRFLCREPVWPSGKALGWQAEGPRFESASALLSLQKVWSMDTVL